MLSELWRAESLNNPADEFCILNKKVCEKIQETGLT